MSRRPTDWSPLAGSDPVPGDPDEIERVARSLTDMAEEITRQAANLRRLSTAEGWDADAGRIFADSARDLAGQLAQAQSRYATAGGALRGYAPELRHAQSVADAALTDAKAAQGTINANQLPDHPPSAPTPDQATVERHRQHAYDGGIDALYAAQRKLAEATDHRDEHAGRAERAIRDSIDHDGLKDSWWDKFTNWVSEHADLFRAIARIAELVATVLSAIALVIAFIPVLNFLAPVLLGLAALASAVALVCTIMLALAGEASWTDVGLALLSVAAVGVAGTAVRLASRAGRASRAASSARTGGCFVAGTMVLTVDGRRSIESLLVGDEVVTRDPHSGRRVIRSVVAHFRHTVPVLLRLTVQGIQINCSPEHPFWTDVSGWKKAADLSAGDVLVDMDGARRPVSTITRRQGTFVVHNIEVDGLRTYHVSELHLLVHNKPRRIPRPEGTPKKVDDKYLKRKGVDPHTAKEDLPGPASRFDIYVDKKGNMFGVPKRGKPEDGEYLGNIEDY